MNSQIDDIKNLLSILNEEDTLIQKQLSIRFSQDQILSLYTEENILHVSKYFILRYKKCLHFFNENSWSESEIKYLLDKRRVIKVIRDEIFYFKIEEDKITQLKGNFIINTNDISLDKSTIAFLIKNCPQKKLIRFFSNGQPKDAIACFKTEENKINIKVF